MSDTKLLNECLFLRAAMRAAIGCLDDPTAQNHGDMREAGAQTLRNALDKGQKDIPDLLAENERLHAALKLIRFNWAGHAEQCATVRKPQGLCDCDWPEVMAQCDAALDIAKTTS